MAGALDGLIHVDRAIDKALNYVEGRMKGTIKSLKTPWTKFNEAHLDGIEWQKIIVFAGMSSSGKTAIVNQLERELIALNPDQNFAILNFTFEMPASQVIIRDIRALESIETSELLSSRGQVLTQKRFEQVSQKIRSEMGGSPIYYIEMPQTVAQYIMICEAFYERMGIPFITISDHSILFKKASDEKDHLTMLYNLADGLNHLKKKLPITQIMLSQLNREIENIDRRKPKSALNYPDKSCIFGAKFGSVSNF